MLYSYVKIVQFLLQGCRKALKVNGRLLWFNFYINYEISRLHFWFSYSVGHYQMLFDEDDGEVLVDSEG